MVNENEPLPKVPEDPMFELVAQLRAQEDQRRKAVDLAFKQFETAETDEDKSTAVNNLLTMLGVHGDFKESFPAIFPDEPPESPQV